MATRLAAVHASMTWASERGAISILAAGSLLTMLVLVALAIDLGRIAHARARLQQQVDAAALAGAYSVGSCTESPEDPGAVAQQVAERNGFSGTLTTPPSEIRLGVVSTSGGLRQLTPVGNVGEAEAVEIRARTGIPRSLVLPRILGGEITLEAHAAARSRALAGISLSSSLATLEDPEQAGVLNDVLGGMLGSAVSLDVLSYQGLVDARVSVGELLTAQGSAATVDELLDLTLTSGQLLTLVATALDTQGSLAAIDVGSLAAAATSPASLRLGDWLQVASGSGDAALDASLGVLDLLRTGIVAINGSNVLVIDPLTLNVPGVASTSMRVQVVEPPQIAIGPPGQDPDGDWYTEVRTAQTRIELLLEADLPFPLGGATVYLPLFATQASSTARLETIHCPRADDPVSRATVGATAGAASIGIGTFIDLATSDVTAPAVLVDVTLAGLPLARIDAFSVYDAGSTSEQITFEGPFVPRIAAPAPEHTQRVGTNATQALQEAQSTFEDDPGLEVTVLGILPLGTSSGDLQDDTRTILDPIFAELPAALDLVLETAGLSTNGGDLTLLSLHARRPELVR